MSLDSRSSLQTFNGSLRRFPVPQGRAHAVRPIAGDDLGQVFSQVVGPYQSVGTLGDSDGSFRIFPQGEARNIQVRGFFLQAA